MSSVFKTVAVGTRSFADVRRDGFAAPDFQGRSPTSVLIRGLGSQLPAMWQSTRCARQAYRVAVCSVGAWVMEYFTATRGDAPHDVTHRLP